VRLARLEYVSGKVTWRPDTHADWSTARVNLSLGQGAEIWTSDGGRAEIRFSDGSLLRSANGVVILKSLFTDDQGEFTQVQVLSGLATVRPRQERSVFEIETPSVSVKTSGPSRVRVGVTDVVEVGVHSGRAVVEGSIGKTTLMSGEFLRSRSGDKEYVVRSLPEPDSWERWNDERDRVLAGGPRPGGYRPGFPPPSIWIGLDFPIFTGHFHHRRW
jgi:hypothetical protein